MGGELVGAGGEGADGAALVGLGLQHRSTVRQQGAGGRQGPVGGLGELAAAVQQCLEVLGLPGERVAELVDHGLQGLQRDGLGEGVDAGQHGGDRGRGAGVGLPDGVAADQVGGPVGSGLQVEVLLAGHRQVRHLGVQLTRDVVGGVVQVQVGLDSVVGEPDRPDPADGDPAVGDVRVLEQAPGLRQVHPHHVVAGHAEQAAHVRVVGAEVAQYQHGQRQEGDVLDQDDAPEPHLVPPRTALADGSGKGRRASARSASAAGAGGKSLSAAVSAGMIWVSGGAARSR